MRVSDAVAAIAERVEAEGLLLVHDQRLPSVTSLICGEPVRGSWWSHPLANVIYNALGTLDDRFATCKLISKKLTLVAPRLWSDLAAVGRSKEDWQVNGLSPAELALLDEVDTSAGPVVLDRPLLRAVGRSLEARLLVAGDEVHSNAGYHFKALLSWDVWEHERGVLAPLPDPRAAGARFEQIVRGWEPRRSLLPWPPLTTPK